MKKLTKSKVIMIIFVAIILIAAAIGISLTSSTETETVEVNGQKNVESSLKEEVISEVKEEIIQVPAVVGVQEEEVVEAGDIEVVVPKSTVASVNSSEDAEKNKKTGGESVSQQETTNMFQNVGTKSFGIDVSAHQGKINWSAVKASGVDFAIIRAGFRGQTAGSIYEDAYFKTNVAGAAAAGVKVGIYFYSTAVNEQEALEEAAWVVSKIKTYRITYPVVYDFEDFGAYRCKNVNGAQATSNAITFLNFVSNAGYEPMMYANKSDITSRMSRSSFGCKFWLAHYTSQTDYSGSYQMWQYTSKGSVPGISGNVDMDIAYFSYGAVADAKHEHNFSELVKNSTVNPTCTKDGSKVMRCSCGDTEKVVLPATGHSFSDWVVTKKATYDEEGEKTRTCSVCKEVETEKIDKLSNTDNTTNTNTESLSGNTNTNVTPDENTTQNTNTTPSNQTDNTPQECEHNKVLDTVNSTSPTCSKAGVNIYICSKCNKELGREDVPATGAHEYDESGVCKICGEAKVEE